MNPLTLRAMADADLSRVAELSDLLGYPIDLAALRENVARVRDLPDHGLFVAADPDLGIVGWTHVRTVHTVDSGSYAEISSLIVDSTCRRRGVGRALVEAVEGWARDRGFDQLRVRSNVVRPESHRFYPGVGLEHQKTQHVYGKRLR